MGIHQQIKDKPFGYPLPDGYHWGEPNGDYSGDAVGIKVKMLRIMPIVHPHRANESVVFSKGMTFTIPAVMGESFIRQRIAEKVK